MSYRFDPNRLTRNALQVRDLIQELEQMDRDAYVVFQSDYGDHTHTQQALFVESVDELDTADQALYDSPGYSRSGVAIRERDEGEQMELADADPEVLAEIAALPTVVILS